MTNKFKQSKTQNIPKLRFPEFSENWREDKLEDIGLNVIDGDRGENYPNSDDFFNDDYCLFLNAGNVTKEGFLFNKNTFITEEKDNQLKKGKLKKYDIILTTRGSVGHIAYYNDSVPFENLRINSGMVLIRNNNKNIDTNFVYKFLASPKIKNRILRISFGSAQPQLTVKEIVKLKFSFPSLPEQQKIANFLGSVDKWIKNLRTQKESLVKYKKGIMQKVFPKQGESVPEIRFDGFSGDWGDEELSGIVSNVGGTALEGYVNNSSKYKFISIGNYSIDGKYIDNGQRISFNEKTKTKLLDKDNLVMVLNDKTTLGDLIGATILINKNDQFIYNQRSERLICKEDCDCKFVWHLLNSKSFRKKIFAIAQGGTQIYVNFPSVKKLKIKIPLIQEQKKIASFLTTLDNKIDNINKKLTQAETFKKGLLQGLFV